MNNALVEKTLARLDAIAPPPEEDSRDGRRRVRVLVLSTIAGATILFSTAASTLLFGFGVSASVPLINLAWGAAVLASIPFSRWLRSSQFLAFSLITLCFTHTLMLSVLAGGRHIGALFGFAVFPLLAVLVAGWRAGLLFTGFSAAAVILTPRIPLDLLARTDIDSVPVSAELIRDALNVTFAVGFLSVVYDAVRNLTLSDARRARESAEESQTRVQVAADRQRQLIEISRRLQDATVETFEEEIDRAMELTAGLAGADRTVLQLLDAGDFVGRFSWGEEPTTPLLVHETTGPAQRAFKWTADSIGKGRILSVARLSDLPAEADPERGYLESRGTVSWLCVPIFAGRTMVGYQIFETTEHEKIWNDEESDSLRLMTELLAAAVIRHRTTRALLESEKKFAGAFRNHPDAMAITDLETDEILECNEQWLHEMAASTREDVLGRTPWEFGFSFPDEQLTLIRNVLKESGRTPAIEVPVLGRAGDQRVYLISGTCIDIAGRPCVLVHLHDLTARKALEQQLLHAQKMEAVGRLAGGIAHDFNNMLTVISGYSSSLIDRLDGDDRTSAEEIHQAARRSADLTRQLLAFSRKQMLQTEVLDPNTVLSNLESMLRPLIGESIDLRLDLDISPGLIRSDRGQLEQALVNLVVNARDAMSDGGTMTLSTRRAEHSGGADARPHLAELEPGPYVVISVVDEGTGIDPTLLDHVMEPFYTTKAEGEGTGLGLPMVHGVARQCGGTLLLENNPRGGTRAEIHLPAVDGPPASASPESAATGTKSKNASTQLILLVEDEPTLRRLAARTLRAAGYEVIEAEDGERAAERAAEMGDSIDIVLSDVVMPNLSGTELVKRLRQERPDLPVVLMSGYPETGDDARPIPDDVLFLLKPFEPSQLCRAIESALRGKSEADLEPVD